MTAAHPEAAAAPLRRAGALEASVSPLPSGGAVAVAAGPQGWRLLAWTPAGAARADGFEGETRELDGGTLLEGAPTHANAAALRARLDWVAPRPLMGGTSVGTGDRLGIATPGHVAAFRMHSDVAPVLAQQSARELGRTGRTFRDVVDAATFGALAAGWRAGYGADGDHLKTIEELEGAISGGCVMFTADPIDHVPRLPADAPAEAIRAAFADVPWDALEDTADAFAHRYPDRLDADGVVIELRRDALISAAARYGGAVVQVVAMYRHLEAAMGGRPFAFEVAVDELDHPTTPVDHVYLATELRRLGVRWQGMAPRWVGRFEKGIEYVGDPAAFERDIAVHAAIGRAMGPYRMSVHSGSDKHSIYRAAAEATRGEVHLKTSGTSYLEALRTIGRSDPELLRAAWTIARRAYAQGRASYVVSAAEQGMPEPVAMRPAELLALLDDPGTREVLHVTYGAVLHDAAADGGPAGSFGARLRSAAWDDRDAYWADLAAHIGRHLEPFGAPAARTSRAGGAR